MQPRAKPGVQGPPIRVAAQAVTTLRDTAIVVAAFAATIQSFRFLTPGAARGCNCAARLRAPNESPPDYLLPREPDHLGQVQRAALRSLLDLLTAAEPIRDDERV
jgi:hypothetical protein